MSLRVSIDKCSIVVAGLWNPYIFSPEWIAANLLQEPLLTPEANFEVAVGPGVASQIRILLSDVIISPTRQMVQFQPQSFTDSCLVRLENMAVRMLAILPHTPLKGYGVNFGFECSTDQNAELFNAKDYSDLHALDLEPTQRQIVRNLRHTQHCTLNLFMSIDVDKNVLNILCNFHHSPTKEGKLDSQLVNDKVLEYKMFALNLLKKVYGETLEAKSPND